MVSSIVVAGAMLVASAGKRPYGAREAAMVAAVVGGEENRASPERTLVGRCIEPLLAKLTRFVGDGVVPDELMEAPRTLCRRAVDVLMETTGAPLREEGNPGCTLGGSSSKVPRMTVSGLTTTFSARPRSSARPGSGRSSSSLSSSSSLPRLPRRYSPSSSKLCGLATT